MINSGWTLPSTYYCYSTIYILLLGNYAFLKVVNIAMNMNNF